MKNNRGFIDTSLIVISVLLLGLVSAVSLVKQSQELRKKADWCYLTSCTVSQSKPCWTSWGAAGTKYCTKSGSWSCPAGSCTYDCCSGTESCGSCAPSLPTNIPNTPIPAPTNTIAPAPCSPYLSYRCSGSKRQQCQGGGWVDVENCSYGCSNGNCNPAPTNTPTLTPSSCSLTSCISISNTLCTSGGYPGCHWDSSRNQCCPPSIPTLTPRPTATPTFSPTCTTGSKRCSNGYLQYCSCYGSYCSFLDESYCWAGCNIIDSTHANCQPTPTPTNTPVPTNTPTLTPSSCSLSSCISISYTFCTGGGYPGCHFDNTRNQCCPPSVPTLTPRPPTPTLTLTPSCIPENSICTPNGTSCCFSLSCQTAYGNIHICRKTPPPTVTPTPTTASVCSQGQKRCFSNNLQTCTCLYGACSWHEQQCPSGCTTINGTPACNQPPTSTPTPTINPLYRCDGNILKQGNLIIYECTYGCDPILKRCKEAPTPTPTPILKVSPTVTPKAGILTVTPTPTTIPGYRCVSNNLVYLGRVVETCNYGCNPATLGCNPVPSSLICQTAGAKRCSSDGYYTQTCDGTKWLNEKFCSDGCDSGNISCKKLCTPAEKKCATGRPINDQALLTCNEDGTGWMEQRCVYPCLQGEKRCSTAGEYGAANLFIPAAGLVGGITAGGAGAAGTATLGLAAAKISIGFLATGLAGQIGTDIYRNYTGGTNQTIEAIDYYTNLAGQAGATLGTAGMATYYGGQIVTQIVNEFKYNLQNANLTGISEAESTEKVLEKGVSPEARGLPESKYGKEVGSGAFGTVYIDEKSHRATKIFNLEEGPQTAMRKEEVTYEIETLQRFGGRLLPKFEGVVYNDAGEPIGYQMEAIRGATLSDFAKPVPENLQNEAVYQLEKLQSQGFIHGDIHEYNIMIETSRGGDPMRVRLIDPINPSTKAFINEQDITLYRTLERLQSIDRLSLEMMLSGY